MLWLLLAVALFGLSAVGGALAGYQAGEMTRLAVMTEGAVKGIDEQYQLGLQDLAEQRYEIAYQRFEWVLNQDPAYPGAPEKMAEVMAVLFATATPTPLPPTITPTATPDLRPVQDLFAAGQARLAAGEWSAAIDTLISLRQADPAYQTAQVDGMLYIALRQRGVQKIMDESNLQGGIFDLALAEQFGPLDGAAETAREMAHLFTLGNSFWGAYPAQAVYYFAQVAAGAPYMRDSSGYTATERYRGALIQLGDAMLGEDPCGAQAQYEHAYSIRSDADLSDKITEAALLCSPPTEIPTETETPTPTWTPTLDLWTPSATFAPPTATPTLQPEPPTVTPAPPTEPPPPTEPAPPTDAQPAPTEPAPLTEPPPATTEPPAPSDTPAPEVTQGPVEGQPTP